MYSLILQLINSSIHELASSQIYEKRLSTRYCDREQQRRRWKDNVRAEHRRWTRYERTEATHHRFRPQANASLALLGPKVLNLPTSIYDVLLEEDKPLRDIITPTPIKGLDLAPSHPNLANVK